MGGKFSTFVVISCLFGLGGIWFFVEVSGVAKGGSPQVTQPPQETQQPSISIGGVSLEDNASLLIPKLEGQGYSCQITGSQSSGTAVCRHDAKTFKIESLDDGIYSLRFGRKFPNPQPYDETVDIIKSLYPLQLAYHERSSDYWAILCKIEQTRNKPFGCNGRKNYKPENKPYCASSNILNWWRYVFKKIIASWRRKHTDINKV